MHYVLIIILTVNLFAVLAPLQRRLSEAEILSFQGVSEPKERALWVIEKLPFLLDDADQFNRFVSLLDLEALDKSHVGIMAASVIDLESAFRSTRGTFEMTGGGAKQTMLLSRIILRIEVLLLGDNRAFRKSRERSSYTSMGFKEHLQALSEWCLKENRETESAMLIPAALAETQVENTPKRSSAKASHHSTSATEMSGQDSVLHWPIIAVMSAAALGLVWLLLKRRKV